MRYVLFFCLIILLSQKTKAQNIDLLWKARGVQAVERLDSLAKIKVKSKKLAYEKMCESAYSFIAAYPDNAIKHTDLATVYHLFFNFGDDGNLDIAYVYDKNQTLLALRVDALPKKRSTLISKDANGFVSIVNNFSDNDPILVFSTTNPFEYVVLASE